jgi:hypothetical protein
MTDDNDNAIPPSRMVELTDKEIEMLRIVGDQLYPSEDPRHGDVIEAMCVVFLSKGFETPDLSEVANDE